LNYLLYINDESSSHLLNSLDEAKQFATRFINCKSILRIEGYSSSAPISNWIYDYQIRDWVEQKLL